MKASLTALTAALLIAACPWAQAASSVDLAVKGVITPSACTPSLSGGGVIDYGKIAAQDLDPVSVTYLPKVSLDFAVNCEAHTLLAVQAQDNRPQNFTPRAFGFTPTSTGSPLGAYFIDVSNFLADGVPVIRMYSPNNGQGWVAMEDFLPWAPNVLTAFGDTSSGKPAPVPTQHLTMSMLISGHIFFASNLPLEEEIPIDGSATIEVRYL
jgi:hypothetical protein